MAVHRQLASRGQTVRSSVQGACTRSGKGQAYMCYSGKYHLAVVIPEELDGFQLLHRADADALRLQRTARFADPLAPVRRVVLAGSLPLQIAHIPVVTARIMGPVGQ